LSVSEVVVVHDVGQQVRSRQVMHAQLFAALRDGVAPSGADIAAGQVELACYGGACRPRGEVLGAEELFDAEDVADGFEQELPRAWWEQAAAVDEWVVPPDEEVLFRVHTGSSGHDLWPYLTERLTGAAIAAGMRG
jgi:hypothetical protein